jgi:hypothetical protein
MENTRLIGTQDPEGRYLGRLAAEIAATDTDLAFAIENRWNNLKELRKPTEELRWEACAYVGHRTPFSKFGYTPVPKITLYNATGIEAYQTFVNGFVGNLVSQNFQWFNLVYKADDFTDSDAIYGCLDYCNKVQQLITDELNKSNFYPEDRMAAMDMIAQGTSAQVISENKDDGMVVTRTVAPWQFWIDQDYNGKIDTFFWEYSMTNAQARDRFSEEKLPKEIRDEIGQGFLYIEHSYLYCIYPRKAMKTGGRYVISTEKRYAAVDYSVDYKKAIKEGGFDRFPVIVSTYERNGNSPYGSSPIINILPELRKLNSLSYKELKAIDKNIDPPMAIHESLKNRVSLDPGSKLYVASMDFTPKPMVTSIDVSWAESRITACEDKVKKLLHNNLFNYLFENMKVYTATQIQALDNQELTILSAVFGNLQWQKINPLLKEVFMIMYENGRIPKPPKEMIRAKNPSMQFELDGPLARSLKVHVQRDGVNAMIELCERFSAMQQPQMLDNFDLDELARKAAISVSAPMSALVEVRDRDAKRQMKQQLIQQQMQMQQALQASEVERNMNGRSNLNNAQGVNQ